MGILWILIGIVIAADGAAIGFTGTFNPGEFITMAVGAVLIIYGLHHRRFVKKRLFKYFVRIMMSYFVIMSLFLFAYGQVNDTDYNEDYVIVLGGGIKDERPTAALQERLDRAVEYHRKNPDAKIIVTGGKGGNENVPEAEVMYDYLAEQGVDTERLIKESEAHNTYENFSKSKRLMNYGSDTEVVTISSDYHMFRSKLYASMSGIDTHTLSSHTQIFLVPTSYIRESLAVIKMLVYYIPKHNMS